MSTERPTFELPAPDLGAWRAGNTGTEGVWRFESGVPGAEVLVTALIHGNEVCGAWALRALLEAGLRPRCGALTLAFCNLAAFDRFDIAAPEGSRYVDEDLNRVWGAMPWRATGADTCEKRRALELLPFAEQAEWLLDLHSMSNPGPPLVLTGLPSRHMALARRIGMPELAVADAGHAAGCRLRDHGRFGDHADLVSRALLIECGFHGELPARDVAVEMLGRFLVEAGTLDEVELPAGWLRPLPAAVTGLEVTEAVTAVAGEPPRLAQRWATGQRVEKAGTLLGWNGGEPFRTPYDGCTLIMPSIERVKPGMTIVRLARDAAQND